MWLLKYCSGSRRQQFSTFIDLLVLFTSLSGMVVPSVANMKSHYDFIIVGGGTAGCALGRRLADDGRYQVLILESGGIPKEGMEIPVYAPRFVPDPELTYRYRSLPQRYAARQQNGTITYVSGKVLGGTSSINYMWFNRGHSNDYDNWASITADDSWLYTNLLPYFKRIETYEGDFPSDQHGYNGPITISQPRYAPGLREWLAAGRELGYPIADPNGPQRVSFAPTEFSKRRGQRDSSFMGYIKPILFSRPKLHIVMNSNATQIIFQGKKAIGVRFQTRGSKHGMIESVVYAKKEIILSAGVIGSPLLLQRSGIGHRGILKTAKIPVIQNLPVGARFHDHVSIPIYVYINNSAVVMDERRDLTPENLQLYKLLGDGPYSSTRGGVGQAFVVSSVARSKGEGNWPDIHLTMSHSVQPYLAGHLDSEFSNLGPDEVPISIAVFLTRPVSRGTLYINPRDVYGPPLLDVGYFSDPSDIQRLLDGIKEAVKIFDESKSYQKLGARIAPADFPDCDSRPFKSEQYWKCYIRQESQAGLHAGGTCRMGKGLSDPDAVVDPQLRVLGVSGLRVVDTSVMPAQTNANPHAAAYVIAEKAAAMILKYWSVHRR